MHWLPASWEDFHVLSKFQKASGVMPGQIWPNHTLPKWFCSLWRSPVKVRPLHWFLAICFSHWSLSPAFFLTGQIPHCWKQHLPWFSLVRWPSGSGNRDICWLWQNGWCIIKGYQDSMSCATSQLLRSARILTKSILHLKRKHMVFTGRLDSHATCLIYVYYIYKREISDPGCN